MKSLDEIIFNFREQSAEFHSIGIGPLQNYCAVCGRLVPDKFRFGHRKCFSKFSYDSIKILISKDIINLSIKDIKKMLIIKVLKGEKC